MTRQEKITKSLCTIYKRYYLEAEAEALANGKPPVDINHGIFTSFPDLTAEELQEAISHYDDAEYKQYRKDWWVHSDREYDIQTLCMFYSLEALVEQRDNLRRGIIREEPEDEADRHDVLYNAGIDVIEEAIACYYEEKYQRVRAEMNKE